MNRVEVVAAVLQRSDGSFLLAQRPADKVYAGYWEFPGGKVEPGEAPADALTRELHEELGIEVERAYPWITRDYDYEHAAVRLRFYRVTHWSGELRGRERQRFEWQDAGRTNVAPLLPANGPILRALALPTFYAISNAAQVGAAPFLKRLEAALERGLRLMQIREKSMPAAELEKLVRESRALARTYGARILLNDDGVLSKRFEVDGVHLTASRLMAATRRPAFELVGASCHDEAELAHAAAIGADFVVLGPVAATESHPGARLLGWEKFETLRADYPLPVFAVGGLGAQDFTKAWQSGAHGIAAIRQSWVER